MPSKDYYSILGVSKTATDDEIKKAFRRLAHEHHPDKGGDPQKFKDANEAYQVLGNAEKRRTYDQFGSAAFEQWGSNGAQGFGQGFDGFNINIDDLGDFVQTSRKRAKDIRLIQASSKGYTGSSEELILELKKLAKTIHVTSQNK